MIRTERASQLKLKTDVGVWIEQFITTAPRGDGTDATAAPAANPGMDPAMVEIMMRRRGMPPGGARPGMEGGMVNRRGYQLDAQTATPDAGAAGATTAATTNEVSTITLKCRAVNLAGIVSEANTKIIYALQNELRASTNYFDAALTEVVGTILTDDATGTFTFDVKVVLKHPLKP